MLKTKYKKRVSVFRVYHREISLGVLFVSTLFLIVSLATYSMYDPSWFYYASYSSTVSNACGFLGAHCAAFFMYLWGGAASWACIALLLFVVYLYWYNKKGAQEWDRLLAFSIMICIIATLSNVYSVDTSSSVYPGGFIGYTVHEALLYWFGSSGMFVFLYTMLLVCAIVIIRFSGMQIIINGVRLVRSLTWKKKLIDPLVDTIIAGMQWVKRGSAVRTLRTSLRALCGSEHQESSRAWLEYELQEIEKHEKDDFWKTIVQHDEQPTFPLFDESSVLSPDNRQNASVPLTSSSEQDVNEKTLEEKLEEKVPGYTLPNVSLFIGTPDEKNDAHLVHELELRAQLLQEKLERFGVSGTVVGIKRGPVVTLFEYKPAIDTKISKIVALEDDLALALQALSIRIIAPIPGKAVVGFEVANTKRKSVALADSIQSSLYTHYTGLLPLILGKNTIGADVIVDLACMPHLLVAGSTGSGKSVALNAMLVSLLCKRTPQEMRLILIDPKRLEFTAYAHISHLLFPIVTNPRHAAPILQWVVKEMEDRYTIMAAQGARNLADYNSMVSQEETKPLIVVVIDELADLMMTAGRDIESLIARITQMARAAGIHMIVATQRPSVDVITGLIKVNFPSRISFRVTSKIDSRTILDCGGADKLLGKGDMLFLDASDAVLKRVHGAYVSDKEIIALMNHIRAQGPAHYLDLVHEIEKNKSDLHEADDILYDEVLEFLQEMDEVSISLLQRKFRIGYNRSARIIELLEARGLVLSSDSGKTRKVVR